MRPETRCCSGPLLVFQPPNDSTADIEHAIFVIFQVFFDSLEHFLLGKPTDLCPVVALKVRKHSVHVNEGMLTHEMEFHGRPSLNFWHIQATCAVKQDKHTSFDEATPRGCWLYLVEDAQEAGRATGSRNMIFSVVVWRSGHHLFQPYRLSPNMRSEGGISDKGV